MKVTEIFSSIQGEGRFVGEPTVFVRLAGCNMMCTFCDTKYAWEGGEDKSIEDVVKEVEEHGIPSVCITGGEPMLQKEEVSALVGVLKSRGYKLVLETNGSIYDEEVFSSVDSVALDMKPPSSGEKSDESILDKLDSEDYVKVVVADEADLEYAKKITGKTQVQVYLQPADTKKLNWLAEKVMKEKISARVLPQLHKLMGLK